MASAPWYLNNDRPSLKHQKNWKGGTGEDSMKWYDRGVKVYQATKYRKGACENCGSMTHKTKDCLERPRSKGAKWTGKGIAADDLVQDLGDRTFEAKRDRWNGYLPEDWIKQAEKFEKISEIRRETRQKELLKEKFADEKEKPDVSIEEERDLDNYIEGAEEDKVDEEEAAAFAKLERRVRSAGGGSTGTVRNLRIREDTAKYLLNLDVNSAYYDPKSRSMREDPNPSRDLSAKAFAGENFVRQSGAAKNFQELNMFSVTAFEKGQDVHAQATPSQAEAAFRAFKAKKDMLKSGTKSAILDKYGNVALAPTEESRAIRGTEAYAEYDPSGRLIRGQETKARSRYEEDVFPGNHKSIWGSWWHDGSWGYACCHQTLKNAYCTGSAGTNAAAKQAAEASSKSEAAEAKRGIVNKSIEDASNVNNHSIEIPNEKDIARSGLDDDQNGKDNGRPSATLHDGLKASLWGTENETAPELDEDRLKQAILRQEKNLEQSEDNKDDRKRPFNSLGETCEVTEEDMEAYRLKRGRGEDPLTAIEKAKKASKQHVTEPNKYDLV